ncbi:hypothetical protein [Brevundimonas sp.]|uniref:hypothetical protein n=1 Tax=Brevundimonas sp. TaxID=1871086 RepID=UPI00272FE514|nr:hypothetical protein [Brevundimonas sp.]MDP1913974.1 hypothetical protein [Brevundimonas sp.]
MSLIKLLVAALALLSAQPALAQDYPGGQSASDRASNPGSERGPSNLARDAHRDRRQRQEAPAAAPTPEDVRTTAQAQAVAAGLSCQVTEASNPGVTAEQTPIYEAACADGPGYILIASTPPQAFNCLELAGTAATARLRDPAADVGQQCLLPANQNGLAIIGGWARGAGVACAIDEAVAIGKSDADNIVYEIGCAGADGYWLEQIADGWDLKDCLRVASTGGACRFTTAQEQADGFEARLVGTDAAACDVTGVRLMGQNANGRFYEAKCAAEGQGFIARVNAEGATQQIYPCATAQRIGGGCTLTQVAAPPVVPGTEP